MATQVSSLTFWTSGSTSLRVQARNAVSGVAIQARTATGIREDVAGSGIYCYSATLTDAPVYEIIWDAGGATFDPATATAELFIPPVSVIGGATTVLAATAPASLTPLSFTIKRGDTDPSIVAQALYQDPANPANMIPWPIPGGSAVKFTMRDNADLTTGTRTSYPTSPKVHATASIDDAPNGIMSYGWTVGDTDTDGLFRGEFEVTSGSEIRTFPVGTDSSRNWIAITITDDLDPGITP